jgi:hypothetical protein
VALDQANGRVVARRLDLPPTPPQLLEVVRVDEKCRVGGDALTVSFPAVPRCGLNDSRAYPALGEGSQVARREEGSFEGACVFGKGDPDVLITGVLDIRSVPALNRLGRCHREAGRWDTARSAYGRVLKIEPKNRIALAGIELCIDAQPVSAPAPDAPDLPEKRSRGLLREFVRRAQLFFSDVEEGMESFENRDAEFLRWLQENPRGYFLNFRTDSDVMLHRAPCSATAFDVAVSLTRKRKVCSRDREQLVRWAYGRIGVDLCACSRCKP